VEYSEFLEFIRGRRTTRAIKPDSVPEETVMELLEAARWAPTGFNMQPAELLVVRDPELRASVRKIVQDWIDSDFYALEATREPWQGAPWTLESNGRLDCPMAPLFVFILGDTRRRAGLPMNARYSRQKGDSIFESSLANAFMYLWLSAHSLGLAAQPVSQVKNSRVQGLVKHLLNLPDFIYMVRHLDEMVHFDRAADDEFLSEEEIRKQIRKLRSGNVARHSEADRINPKE
jgi:nitroreductase